MLKNMPKELTGNALDDDALDRVAGGAGANSGRVEADGTVIEIQPNGIYQVDIGGGQTVVAAISGKLRMNYIRITPGDRVRVEYTPGDLSYGRITWRYK